MSFHLEYNFKGILPVSERALKGKKIIVSAFYILIALFLYNLFTFVALALDGANLADFYTVHKMAPINLISFSTVTGALTFYLGAILSLLSIMMGMMAVAAFDFEEMRGNVFLSAGGAIKFSLSRIKQLLLSELAIVVFVGLFVLLGFILGLISRLPYMGEWLYAIFFFFPNFIFALFIVLIIFVLLLSILIMPVAVMADRNGETFNSLLETFLTVVRKPVRWIGYTLYSLISAKIAGFIFACFSFWAIQFLQFSTSLGGGEKIKDIISAGMHHLDWESKTVTFIATLFPGLNLGLDISGLVREGNSHPVGYIMAISLFLIFVMIWGYILSVIATGQAYAYAIIKKIRDGYAITDEKSLFYEEEWVNPPILHDKGTSESNDIST